jgi:hypothetical protein
MSKGDSAFKSLFTEMIKQNGNYSAIKADLKKPIKCIVKEAFPYFLVTDGYFYVPAYFTKGAVDQLRKSTPNINIVDLEGKVIVINKWQLEIKRVNSAEVFTSYANLEIRLIVNEFSVKAGEKVATARYPINLFRDDEMKTTI